MKTEEKKDFEIPGELPFLKSISWFDSDYRQLTLLEILRRYESGWRYRGALGEPSREEYELIKALVARFGSFLDVST